MVFQKSCFWTYGRFSDFFWVVYHSLCCSASGANIWFLTVISFYWNFSRILIHIWRFKVQSRELVVGSFFAYATTLKFLLKFTAFGKVNFVFWPLFRKTTGCMDLFCINGYAQFFCTLKTMILWNVKLFFLWPVLDFSRWISCQILYHRFNQINRLLSLHL